PDDDRHTAAVPADDVVVTLAGHPQHQRDQGPEPDAEEEIEPDGQPRHPEHAELAGQPADDVAALVGEPDKDGRGQHDQSYDRADPDGRRLIACGPDQSTVE